MPDLSKSSEPIFAAVARIIANGILTGTYPAGSKVPSTTELSTFFTINPITAGRALTLLTDRGILEKRRGIGTFVTPDAADRLRKERIEEFTASYIDPLIDEARVLSIPIDDIAERITARNRKLRRRQRTGQPSQHGKGENHDE